jgi:nucleotide-binding universal stress UspA family protein
MFNHILVPLDGSALAECVIPHARIVAEALGARITLLHVLERSLSPDLNNTINPLDWHIRKTEAQTYLDRMTAFLLDSVPDVCNVIVEGHAPEEVIDYAHHNNVDLIALSSHGKSGLSSWNVSSVVQKIVLRSYISTFIIRAYKTTGGYKGKVAYKKILITLDCSQRAESALPLAISLARHQGARLLLAHVVRRPETPGHLPRSREDTDLAEKLMDRNYSEAKHYLDQLDSQLSSTEISIQTFLHSGNNPAAILDDLVESENVHLVVLCAHGHNNVEKWPYGSVAVNFIAYGTTPLLIMQDIPFERSLRTRAESAARERPGH